MPMMSTPSSETSPTRQATLVVPMSRPTMSSSRLATIARFFTSLQVLGYRVRCCLQPEIRSMPKTLIRRQFLPERLRGVHWDARCNLPQRPSDRLL